MKTKPVAAVYDRRMENEPTLTERRYRAVYDRRMENEPGAHTAPPQVVAAVYDHRTSPTLTERHYRALYDRRMENEPGAHTAPPQVVAAVYDRRASPTLTERRYRKMSLWIVGFLLFLSPLLLAAPNKSPAPPVEPSVAYDTTVKVLRGGTCEVPLRAISPQGYDVKFEILSEPRGGSLSSPQRNSQSSVSYFYTHDGKKNSSQDSFRFKCKSGPQKAWGYAKATILVEEPPARFTADVASLDFGAVFLGESRTLPVRIKNTGGGQLQGRLTVSAPWALANPVDLTLAEGESKKILITFEPLATDTQRGSLIFESGTKPFPQIPLEGVGESRFEVPEKAAFEHRVGVKELRVPVKNRTAAPLAISVHCPPPLGASDSITLPPESSSELVLTLPDRPFAEKSCLVTLSDTATMRDIRIQLPPPPSRIEWEIAGKNQLGIATPGRTVLLTAKLQNTGSSTSRAVIRTTGDGFALARGQKNAFDIPSGEHVIVQAEWKFPETPGVARVSLIADTDGLPPVQATWEADVQSTPAEPEASPSPTPHPGASPSPTPPKVLTKGEQEALRKRMPRDFSYRLEPELRWAAFFPTRRTAVAIVSWGYDGPEPVEFIIQREVQQRKGFFDKNPFERTLPTPEDLPEKSLVTAWTALKPGDSKIQKLPDGRWQAVIPHLSPGYHKIRIIAKQPSSPRMDGGEFSLLVGDIPLPQPLPWTLPSLLVLCATYLLRNKIRSLFG